ncbi:Kap104 protein [Saccharomycopsis crataegensis]|uniref:Kap104 protein n=1 Tax=Saccharomycopsis crataegensis TaxID=43959 RepID=A0AAV5QTW5_9ASCO|nr:Kap104 protein [Saccharomycopsis crataegensis]
MTDWQPEPNSLEQLRTIFSGSLSPDKSIRQQANEALEQARLQPDLDSYLLYILVEDANSGSNIRASAGLLLKNNIISKDFVHSKPKDVQISILNNILKGLLDSDTLVRNITGNVISALFQIYGIQDWPQVLVQLLELANGEKGNSLKSQEGAISALSKICEDSALSLDKEFNGQIPSEFLIPNFMSLLNHQSTAVISKSVVCLNQFITLKSPYIDQHFEELLLKVFNLTSINDDDIRKHICTSFYLILDKYPESLIPHIEGITNFCLHTIVESTKGEDGNEEVALEACEFLLGLATSSYDLSVIKNLLPNMIPILVEKMVYSKADIEIYEQLDSFDDAEIEDKDEDIRPTNARNKEKLATKLENKEISNTVKNASNDDDDDDDDDEDDDEDGSDDPSVWNLRKCSAATLDVLAKLTPQEVISIVLPILKEKIVSDQWPVREAGILAFGAISNACLEVEADKVPSLIPFLVERTQDPVPRVRQITCWTLGRYSGWVCEEAHKNGACANYYIPTLQAVMACALDNKKIVQQSACSCIDSFINNSEYDMIVGLIEPLLEHFNKCFLKYKRKNLVILYGALQTFVDKVGDVVTSKEEYITLLLPPLLEKWEQLPDDDKDLWPLLECMSSVAASLGELFAPYAVPAYQRSLRILQNCINLDKMCDVDPTINSPEKDFIITAIDLIDGLVQGLGVHSAELIMQNGGRDNNTNLVDLLLTCFQDPVHDVRQSAFALLGDLAIFVLRPVVLPYLHPIMQCIINEINSRNYEASPVCNNAAWTLGEMSLVMTKEELVPYLNDIIPSLIGLINDENYEQTVIENAAIAIGRLGTFCAQELSGHLSEFAIRWCTFMKYLESNEEKETSFKGMCSIICANPTGFGSNDGLLYFVDCIASYMHPSMELCGIFQKLLTGYKDMMGAEEWNQFLGNLEMDAQNVIKNRYGA